MTQINWSIAAGPGGFQNALAQGFQMGDMLRQRKEQGERRNALSAYAIDPSVQNFAGLAQAAPEFAMQERGKMQAAQAERQTAELTQRALGGDPEALQQLATVNFDRWKSLSTEQRSAAQQESKILGNAALDVLNRPPEQRAAAVQAYAQQLGQQFPEIAQVAQLPPEQLEAALRSAVAEAGMIDTLTQMERPSYMAIPEGGMLVNTRDNAAVASVAGGQPARVTGEADYNALPPGAQYLDPNGNLRTKGGGGSNVTGGFR